MVNILEKLQVFNKFKFKEDVHKYYCNEKEMETSVTRFMERFSEPFDEQYWAKKKATEEGISVEEMLERWASKARISQILGTSLHATVELLFHNKLFSFDKKAIRGQCRTDEESETVINNYYSMVGMVDKYYKAAEKKLIPVKLEMVVGDEELGIAGCLDALFWNKKTKSLEIFDYKSNETFKLENAYQNLKFPFDNLQETSLNKYSIQLSIYKYFIKKHTGLEIGDCWLVHFDRTQLKYVFYKCLDLTKEVSMVFEHMLKEREEEE